MSLLKIATIALNFLGTCTASKSNYIEQAIRDSAYLHSLGEPNEYLSLYIGSTGVQYSGVSSSF